MAAQSRRSLLFAAPAIVAATPLAAQGAFTRPVRLIIPWAPGGTTDILGRLGGMGVEMAPEPTEAFAQRLRADAEKWGALIGRLGIEAT